VERIQLDQIFTDPQFLIAGSYSLTGYNTRNIARLDFVIDDPPKWPSSGEWREISRDEFLERYDPEDPHMRRDVQRPHGAEQLHFAEFELVSGQSSFAQIVMRAEHPIEQRNLVEHFLLKPAIFFKLADRGVALLNPANVARWTLFPGPSASPADAWKAHRFQPEYPERDEGESAARAPEESQND
jgi:hypothetical protein